MAWKEDVDDVAWSNTYDYVFFAYCGEEGGKSRSPKKVAAVRQNLIKANAARKAKAEARRQRKASQSLAPSENSRVFPPWVR